jgi:hypothetical protein
LITIEIKYTAFILLAAALFLIFSARFIGIHRTLGLEFLTDVSQWIAQRKVLKRWHYLYILIFYVIIAYPISLWHSIAISYFPEFKQFGSRQLWIISLPMPFISFSSLSITGSVFLLWLIITNTAVNTASKYFFPHSRKAKRIAHALLMQSNDQRLRPFVEDLEKRIKVNQIDHDWVIISHDLPITSLWFRQKKAEIAVSARLLITDNIEVQGIGHAYKCEFVKPDVTNLLSRSNWIENEVFTYFITYHDDEEKVCKIGKSNNVNSTLSACRRFNPNANLEFYLPESELSEKDAHQLFDEMRKDGEVFKWEGMVEQFVEQKKREIKFQMT